MQIKFIEVDHREQLDVQNVKVVPLIKIHELPLDKFSCPIPLTLRGGGFVKFCVVQRDSVQLVMREHFLRLCSGVLCRIEARIFTLPCGMTSLSAGRRSIAPPLLIKTAARVYSRREAERTGDADVSLTRFGKKNSLWSFWDQSLFQLVGWWSEQQHSLCLIFFKTRAKTFQFTAWYMQLLF